MVSDARTFGVRFLWKRTPKFFNQKENNRTIHEFRDVRSLVDAFLANPLRKSGLARDKKSKEPKPETVNKNQKPNEPNTCKRSESRKQK